jgi:hypothetical protein
MHKMFAQWWRNVKVLSTFILQRFPMRTVAARKATAAQTQTLAVIGPGQFGYLTRDTLLTKISHVDK